MSEQQSRSKSKQSSNARIRNRIKNNPKNIIRNKVINFDPDRIKAEGGDSSSKNMAPSPGHWAD